MIYALIVSGQIHTTYPTEGECELAANRMAGEQYQAITQWPGGKSLRKKGDEWQVIVGDEVAFRVACQIKQQLTEEEQAQSEEANRQRNENQHRADLFDALKTRVLSDDEMREVLGYGEMINIPFNIGYLPDEKARERSEAFQRQILLRSIQKGSR